ncbi:EAL domain-containing protein [Paraneptunicella aestuarii]|uniref:putative bifunctional diguanylate cyclase/phosphodiesterase n=1 Tax=Paraneptunicella aestuarii TaxID=2831148 RepID=UPI001E47B94E|nr:GGDEF domain-containing phosphodiesterase [Paraneptunicella aestuarii]UAA38354.1 EAL domain-containing protein [Paraneptunicella aestuarii]
MPPTETINKIVAATVTYPPEHINVLVSSLLQKLQSSLKAEYSFIASFDSISPETSGKSQELATVSTLCFIDHGEICDNLQLPVTHSPLAESLNNKNCLLSNKAQQSYPEAQFLKDKHISAYIGVPLRNASAEIIGTLAVMYQSPIQSTSKAISILQRFGKQISLLLANMASNADCAKTPDTGTSTALQNWTEEVYTMFGLKKADETESQDQQQTFSAEPQYQVIQSIEQTHARYLETIIDHLHDAVVTVDTSGIILSANRTAEKMFECEIYDLVGHDISSLMPEPYSSLHKSYMQRYLTHGESNVIGKPQELPALRKSGKEFPMEISISEVEQDGEHFFIGIIRDITERKAAKDQIYQLAYFDSLTKLPNRISFERDILEILTRSKLANANIYCSMLNIDRFSQVNLIYGKLTGDYVLKKVTRRIQAVLDRPFKLYKNVADSFFLLYQAPISPQDQTITQKIRALEHAIQGSVSSQISLKGNSQNLTLAIGSVQISSKDIDHDKFVRLLEFSQSTAKKRGLNSRFRLCDDERKTFERQTTISHSIVKGMENKEFSIQLQPQYSKTGKLISSEALLRWNSPTLGAISPAEFIPLSEDNGDIIMLGEWVLNEVCKTMQPLIKHTPHLKVAVNISGKQVMQPDFCRRLNAALSKWKISPSNLVLEITESTLVRDLELVRDRMNKLASQGFRFSIDDFGTGYSSLIYLRELPIDELKIDRYFIDEITPDKPEVPIVNTIIDMAKALGISIVAEGIETKYQLDYLINKGCHYFQGFYLSNPLSPPDWIKELQEHA